jgi:hypothetical protein
MLKMKHLTLLLAICVITSCSYSKPIETPRPNANSIKLINQKFTNPSNGTVFRLTLGKSLFDEAEFTPIPEGIVGERQPTNSHYSVVDKNGMRKNIAESSISADLAYMTERVKIQHEIQSDRILLTEDTSDALPTKRYILFTPNGSGYRVQYLAPNYESNFENQGFPDSPPNIILLPNNQIWVDGKILPLSRIFKSNNPFSLGG